MHSLKELLSFEGALAQATRWMMLKALCPTVYRLSALAPLNPRKIIFFDQYYETMPDSFTLLYEQLEADDSIEVSFYSLGQGSVSPLELLARNIAFSHRCATASAVFLRHGSSLLSGLPLRRGTQLIQVWHGCGAFKRFGSSLLDVMDEAARRDRKRFPIFGNTTLVPISSEEVRWAYAEAMEIQDPQSVVLALGVSRTDRFYDKAFLESARERVAQAVPGIGERKILLYAPTFRGEPDRPVPPRELDVELLCKCLSDDYALLIKHHPFIKERPAIPEGCRDFAFDVTDDLAIDELMCAADICVTDYSSLIYEYSLLLKPIAFFAYDLDEYLDQRGLYYPYNELTPGPVCKSTAELVDYVLHVNERFDVDAVQAFRDRFMASCDGHATERIIRFMKEHLPHA